MIYVLISGGKLCHKKTEQAEKRDCRILRQPLSLLPKEIKEYIENTKNEKSKLERQLAYTSLFCGLKAFFNVEKAEIKRTTDGKPYLVINGIENKTSKINFLTENNEYQKNEDFVYINNSTESNETGQKPVKFADACAALPCTVEQRDNLKKVYIGISHSDGLAAVCLSDEGEVGIDLQAEIDLHRAKRLNERFFPALTPVYTHLDVRYYTCRVGEDEAVIQMAELDNADNDETARWAYGESLIKLFGGGFSDLKLLSHTNGQTKTELKKYTQDTNFTIAVSTLKHTE